MDLTKYKIHPETLNLINEAIRQVDPEALTETKAYQLADFIFISLYMYSQRIGRDQEHIEYLNRVLKINHLELTNLLGAIDKYQKEIGI